MPNKKVKKKFIKDPDRHLEIQKYKDPIPSRKYISKYLEKQSRPLPFSIIANDIAVYTQDKKVALKRRLKAMVREGQIIENRQRHFGLLNRMNLVKGEIVAKKSGQGAVVADTGMRTLLLPQQEMRNVFPGDKVVAGVARILANGQEEGMIVEVLQRAVQFVTGRYYHTDGIKFISPFARNISQDLIVNKAPKGLKVGSIVKAKMHYEYLNDEEPVCEITQVLGKELTPGLEILCQIHNYNLPNEWPTKVLSELKKIPKKVSTRATGGREDLTKLPFVTIDGEDARDFDDAVYCEKNKTGGFRLFVAIADVSAYVKQGSGLDAEAQLRGNSVYFPGLTIPMLPEVVSNGICSINPHEKRLTLVCEMSITSEGKLTRSKFYEALIISHARLTYTEVGEYLQNKVKLKTGINDTNLSSHIHILQLLYKALKRAKKIRGAIEIDSIENKIVFDKDNKIKHVLPVKRNIAHMIIEECMLIANVATARFLKKHAMQFLYRVHEPPDFQKVREFRTFIRDFGLSLGVKSKEPKTEHYSKLLQQTKNKPYAYLIQTLCLRSLTQAVYSPINVGHFGLAFTQYCHFTSPIRRYPDLITHRAIKHVLSNQDSDDFYSKEEMHRFGEQLSMTERRADYATRDAVLMLKCQYLLDRIGETYDAIISQVTGFGFFVTLQDIFIDGLVHISCLPNDYFIFEANAHRLVGESSKKTYALGDAVRVKLVAVNIDECKVDLNVIVEQQKKFSKSKKRKRTKVTGRKQR